MKLFISGLMQVFFVAINTVFLANKLYVHATITSFIISFIWTYNVKKVAFGTLQDRLVYSFGAACGAALGLYLTDLFM